MLFSEISKLFGSRSGRTTRKELRYFLLLYDAQRECLVDQQVFEDSAEAETAFFEAEREHEGSQMQVLLFGSQSLETVRSTHPHYFGRAPGNGDMSDLFLVPTTP